jgi:hypothetical protein
MESGGGGCFAGVVEFFEATSPVIQGRIIFGSFNQLDQRRSPFKETALALLWQIYSRCCFPPICLLQYGHR